MSRDYDGEWQAACHLLTAPRLTTRTARHIHPAKREINWTDLLESHAWSSGERLLVEAAYGLWRGNGGDLGRAAGLLDDSHFGRLLEAMELYRGDRPDLAVYPGGYR